MFTGIITDIGTVAHIVDRGDRRLTIHCHYPLHKIERGASIACEGVCLTVVDLGLLPDRPDVSWFSVDVSAETLDCTLIAHWQPGQRINLERALCVGDELGGHFVSGHVDGLAEITALEAVNESYRLQFCVPEEYACYLAEKGSIALNGVSLTVNQASGAEAEVNLIPHSWEHTTFSGCSVGDAMHFEVDMLARYAARMLSYR